MGWLDEFETQLPQGIPDAAKEALKQQYWQTKVWPEHAKKGLSAATSRRLFREGVEEKKAEGFPKLEVAGTAAVEALAAPAGIIPGVGPALTRATQAATATAKQKAQMKGVSEMGVGGSELAGELVGVLPYWTKGLGLANKGAQALAKKGTMSAAKEAAIAASGKAVEAGLTTQQAMMAGQIAKDAIRKAAEVKARRAMGAAAGAVVQGLYDATAAEDGQRLTAGLHGAAIGGAFGAAIEYAGPMYRLLTGKHKLSGSQASAVEAYIRGQATPSQTAVANTVMQEKPELTFALETWLADQVKANKAAGVPKQGLFSNPVGNLTVKVKRADGKEVIIGGKKRIDPSQHEKLVKLLGDQLDKGGEIVSVEGKPDAINALFLQMDYLNDARGLYTIPVVKEKPGADPMQGMFPWVKQGGPGFPEREFETNLGIKLLEAPPPPPGPRPVKPPLAQKAELPAEPMQLAKPTPAPAQTPQTKEGLIASLEEAMQKPGIGAQGRKILEMRINRLRGIAEPEAGGTSLPTATTTRVGEIPRQSTVEAPSVEEMATLQARVREKAGKREPGPPTLSRLQTLSDGRVFDPATKKTYPDMASAYMETGEAAPSVMRQVGGEGSRRDFFKKVGQGAATAALESSKIGSLAKAAERGSDVAAELLQKVIGSFVPGYKLRGVKGDWMDLITPEGKLVTRHMESLEWLSQDVKGNDSGLAKLFDSLAMSMTKAKKSGDTRVLEALNREARDLNVDEFYRWRDFIIDMDDEAGFAMLEQLKPEGMAVDDFFMNLDNAVSESMADIDRLGLAQFVPQAGDKATLVGLEERLKSFKLGDFIDEIGGKSNKILQAQKEAYLPLRKLKIMEDLHNVTGQAIKDMDAAKIDKAARAKDPGEVFPELRPPSTETALTKPGAPGITFLGKEGEGGTMVRFQRSPDVKGELTWSKKSKHTSDEYYDDAVYTIADDQGDLLVMETSYNKEEDRLYIVDLWPVDGHPAVKDHRQSNIYGMVELGPAEVRKLFREIRKDFPNVKKVEADRITGTGANAREGMRSMELDEGKLIRLQLGDPLKGEFRNLVGNLVDEGKIYATDEEIWNAVAKEGMTPEQVIEAGRIFKAEMKGTLEELIAKGKSEKGVWDGFREKYGAQFKEKPSYVRMTTKPGQTVDDLYGELTQVPPEQVQQMGTMGLVDQQFGEGAKPFMIIDAELLNKRGPLRGPHSVGDTLWHEGIHAQMAYTGLNKEVSNLVTKHADGLVTKQGIKHWSTFMDIWKGEFRDFGWRQQVAAEEIFTYAATALRVGDRETLQRMADADGGHAQVMTWLGTSARQIRNAALRKEDSFAARALVRRMDFIEQRATGDIHLLNNEAVHLKGHVVDLHNGKYTIFDPMNSTAKKFNSRRELIDYMEREYATPLSAPNLVNEGILPKGFPRFAREINAKAPSEMRAPIYTKEAPEQLGIKPGRLFSFFTRPFYPWLSDVARDIGKPEIFEVFRPFEVATREMGNHMDKYAKVLNETLGKVKPQRQHSLYRYFENPSEEMARELQITAEEKVALKRLRDEFYEPLFKEFGIAESGFRYVSDYAPRMRELAERGELTRTGMRLPKEMDFFAKHVRSGELDPRDTHLLRVSAAYLRLGSREKYLGEPVKAATEWITQHRKELGAYGPLLERHIAYVRGMPDFSQQVMNSLGDQLVHTFNGLVTQANKALPKAYQIEQTDLTGSEAWGKWMMFSYAAGLGLRPVAVIRDGTQTLTTTLPVLGGKYLLKGMNKFFAKGQRDEIWALANKYGASIDHQNLASLYSGGYEHIQPGKITNFAKASMKYYTDINNYGRIVSFAGHREKILDAAADFAVHGNPQKFLDNSAIGWLEKPLRDKYLETLVSGGDLQDLAGRAATDLVNFSHWNYTRGAHPGVYKFAVGRLFGQYGTWPLNYIEYLRKLTTAQGVSKGERIKTFATLAAAHGAILTMGENAGIDTAGWVFLSPAGYGGGPVLNALTAAPQAAADWETYRGAEARREIGRVFWPMSVPGGVQAENLYQMIDKHYGGDEGAFIKDLLGFKPLEKDEAERGIHSVIPQF